MDRTAAFIAMAAHHPDGACRAAARSEIGDLVGRGRLEDAVAEAAKILSPLASDLLEPIPLDESELFTTAAVQLIRERTGDSASIPLRISSPDALDIAGGVDMWGIDRVERIARRDGEGQWNYPMGAAFHPRLLREWTEAASSRDQCRIESTTRGTTALLQVPMHESGYESMIGVMASVAASPEPEWFKPWICRELAAVQPERSKRYRVKERSIEERAASSLQHHSVVASSGKTAGQSGMLIQVTSRHIEILFKTPEAIMKLTAMATQRGFMALGAIRPFGCLVFGHGEDDIRFVRTLHATPPRWLQIKALPAIRISGELLDAMARWVGPCASDFRTEDLEALV
ncbi:MAG: hypothetical protein EBR10_10930 [Planctomycetes bacterium]|nr:hypothetical protein [Planctomycetota bacterium]